ncbi:hypothetical protein QO004_006173 [Rhizobium mesoamericanum]|nr:hypothetical protein [Rhizobium mesoamericanum]
MRFGWNSDFSAIWTASRTACSSLLQNERQEINRLPTTTRPLEQVRKTSESSARARRYASAKFALHDLEIAPVAAGHGSSRCCGELA